MEQENRVVEKEYLIYSEIWEQLVEDIGYNRSGIYKLRCFADEQQKNYIATSRLLASDINGVLYIGSAEKCLVARVMSLRKSLCAAAGTGFEDINAHQCGKKYSAAIQDKFPFKSLSVTIEIKDNNWDAEAIALKDYENEFGELPPFNDARSKG